jgi:hypothetical protein
MYNENTAHPNRHTLYLAESGHGKSTCVKRVSGIPATGARVIIFDPNRDHKAHRYESKAKFAQAVKAGHLSGRGFRFALTIQTPLMQDFETFCEIVCAVLDGSRITYILAEEYGSVSPTAGPIDRVRSPYHYAMWTQARKYGGIIHGCSQRPQNISKDALENAGRIYAGGMGSRAAKSINAETDIPLAEIKALVPGEFIEWQRGKGHKKINVF